MTRVHYKWFVRFIVENRIHNSGGMDLIDFFKIDNDKFDGEKFLNAVYEAKGEYDRKSHESMERMRRHYARS